MPVTINGDGSITGLSVGGLGSGVVNEATIADGAVTQAKRNFATGEVLQVVHNHFAYSGGAHSGLRAETNWTDVAGLSLSITPKYAHTPTATPATIAKRLRIGKATCVLSFIFIRPYP